MSRSCHVRRKPYLCPKCGATDPSAFRTKCARVCGTCKDKRKAEYMAGWLAENGEARKDQLREYRIAHRAQIVVARKLYRAAAGAALRAKGHRYYRANAERLKAQQREYDRLTNYTRLRRQTDPEAARRRARARYAADPAKHKLYALRYRAKRPGIAAFHAKQARARKRLVEATLTYEEWQAILESFGYACAYCLRADRPLTQDHVLEVSTGGAHTAENVVPACGPCNSRKGDRGILYMAARIAV